MSEPATEAASGEANLEDARLMHHSYDGIREYDNPLPGWWRMIFWGTIVFAIGYGLYYHVARWGMTPDQRYRAALAEYDSKKADREAAEAASVSEDVLSNDAKDSAVVQHGAEIFAVRCVSCHTPDGRGLIGPNLTDNYQLHGTSRMDIFKTIKGGVPGTAMLAWGEQLPAPDIVAVAAFVTTLRGKNVPGGKAPQGLPVEAFH